MIDLSRRTFFKGLTAVASIAALPRVAQAGWLERQPHRILLFDNESRMPSKHIDLDERGAQDWVGRLALGPEVEELNLASRLPVYGVPDDYLVIEHSHAVHFRFTLPADVGPFHYDEVVILPDDASIPLAVQVHCPRVYKTETNALGPGNVQKFVVAVTGIEKLLAGSRA